MSEYSDRLNSSTLSIDPMDDDYEDKLRDVAKCFRGFNDALTAFIADHGYDEASDKANVAKATKTSKASETTKTSDKTVATDDTQAKTQFIKDKFKTAGIKVPRSINK